MIKDILLGEAVCLISHLDFTPEFFIDSAMRELRIGDRVLIKSQYDPGCNSGSYFGIFTSDMLTKFGGKTATIVRKRFAKESVETNDRIPDDGYEYKLDIDKKCFFWRSSMFDFGPHLHARIFHE